MTLLYCDSFDHYTALPNKAWTLVSASSIGAYGRNGTSGLRIPNSWGYAGAQLAAAKASLVVGCAFQFINQSSSYLPILGLQDTGTLQVWLQGTPSGAVQVLRGSGYAFLGQSADGLLKPGAYNYLELQATIGAAGSAVVRLNGVVIVNLAGVNTQASGNPSANQVVLGATINAGGNFNFDQRYDDLYVCDTLGARNNAFLGDVRVQAVLPTGAGNYTQWDGLTGAATHWQAQSQNPPDDDASYVSDTLAVAGHIDSYAMGDLASSSGTVAAVQVSAWARKDDAGARTLAPMVRSAGVDAVAAAQALVNTYGFVTSVFETDPGGAAWTIASVNGAEAGVEAVA